MSCSQWYQLSINNSGRNFIFLFPYQKYKEKLRKSNERLKHENYNAVCISPWDIFIKSLQLKICIVICACNPSI